MTSTESLLQIYINYLRKSALSIQTDNQFLQSNHPYQLHDTFQRLVAVWSLRRTVDQLIITNRGRHNFALHEQLAAMKDRFQQRQRGDNKLFDEHTLEPVQVAMRRMLAVKLEDDIDKLQAIFTECVDELLKSGTYGTLVRHIEYFRNEGHSEYMVIRQNIVLKRKLIELQQQLEQHIEDGRERKDVLDDQINSVKEEINATESENQIKRKLVVKWEDSRLEQAERIWQQDESTLEQSILHYRKQIDREQIAMSEIENCIGFKIQHLERTCDEWKQRFDTDTRSYDTQIRTTSDQIADIQAKATNVRRRGAEYQAHIDAYRELQRQRAERRQYEEMLCEQATLIQSWWRGVMVRRQLGPYRPKKKGKKGGGSITKK